MGVYSKIKRLFTVRTNQADTSSFQGVPILVRDYVPVNEVWLVNSKFEKAKITGIDLAAMNPKPPHSVTNPPKESL